MRKDPAEPLPSARRTDALGFARLLVREVLDLEEVRAGAPLVCNDGVGLDNVVRWVHVSELPDIGSLLRGGELILTTGIALPSNDADMDSYVDSLAGAGVSGLIIELGRRFLDVPHRLVERTRHHGLALVALRREVRFVHVTERVHGLLLGQQLEALRASERIHRTFTDLNAEGATVQQIVSKIAELAQAPVFLENLAHQVLAYGPHNDDDVEHILAAWERHSRSLNKRERTATLPAADDVGHWVTTDVSARGEYWGRLLMRVFADATPIQIVAIESGATALALNQLVDRDRETLERQSHRTLLSDIWSGSYSSPASVTLQARHLGVPLADRALVALIVTMSVEDQDALIASEARDRDYAGLVAEVAQGLAIPALVGVLRSGSIGVVLSLEQGADHSAALESFARRVHRSVRQRPPVPVTRIGVGSAVDGVRDLRRSLVEADQVVSASVGMADDRLYFAMPDIRVQGLLYLLRDDPRVQLFVERELGPLLAHDEKHRTRLLDALRAYLEAVGNKSEAATELGISRPALYQRLRRIEHVLGVPLDSGVSLVSLHVAVLALDIVRNAHRRAPPTP